MSRFIKLNMSAWRQQIAKEDYWKRCAIKESMTMKHVIPWQWSTMIYHGKICFVTVFCKCTTAIYHRHTILFYYALSYFKEKRYITIITIDSFFITDIIYKWKILTRQGIKFWIKYENMFQRMRLKNHLSMIN